MSAVKRQQEDAELLDPQTNKKLRLPESEIKQEVEIKQEAEIKQEPEAVSCQGNGQQSNDQKIRRRKVVLLLCYSGWGYLGMQRNPNAKTIEGDLLLAMKNGGMITEEHYDHPQYMLFQRAARTDKGVSAVRQIVSLKLREDADIESINKHLPPQIRVVCMKRTTKGFNSKVNCDARTYSYVLPTFAFSPSDVDPSESFRISEDLIKRINKVLQNYIGTHNFHNFTMKKGFMDPSAKRFMHSFICGEPFVRNNREYIILTVKGQSFMQHHIRKMIGLAIAVVRGFTGEETIQRAFKKDGLDIPKAPGLGLMLEEVHYEGYNKRYGADGVHEKLDWSEHQKFIEEFKEKYILQNILKTEEEEKSMLTWMETLPGHSYSLREDRPPTIISKKKEECAEETQLIETASTETQLTAPPQQIIAVAGEKSKEDSTTQDAQLTVSTENVENICDSK